VDGMEGYGSATYGDHIAPVYDEWEGVPADSDQAVAFLAERAAGGAAIPVAVGDFADVEVLQSGGFALVLVVFNTFFALLSQDDQVRCFVGVAARLAPGGAFVLEAFVPDPGRFQHGQHAGTRALAMDRVHLEASMHDPVEQRVRSQHVVLDERGIRLFPVQLRYAWPSELDLMARLAGLRLAERWAGWRGEPFGVGSPRHVSVYRRPA